MRSSSRARALFIGGTASHAGKSWFATAICRWLRNRGLNVAPFKAQNMSNNSYPAANGGEMGRAQVAQAEACGLDPITDMNPILLKPNSNMGSQVVVDGRVWRNLSASAYYEHFDWLLQRALDAYDRLSATSDFIVIEGAGSVAEVNLRCRDLVNFGFAHRVGAPALLVSDIDRGGVFASLIGTLELLTEQDSHLVRSFALNRFRGDPKLFADGVTFLEHRTARPCLGVFPYCASIRLDEEDSVTLDEAGECGSSTAIVRFPRISNFTDFERLRADWISRPNRRLYDHVILPGTKNTTGDLEWLRATGLDSWVRRQYAAGAKIIGICGGYQMLGEAVDDVPGLSLLPVRTVMQPEKIVKRVRASTRSGTEFDAYEIHMGITTAANEPFAYVDGRPEGAVTEGCIGTYLHGALENSDVLAELGIAARPPVDKDEMYDQMAEWFDSNANTRLFEELYL